MAVVRFLILFYSSLAAGSSVGVLCMVSVLVYLRFKHELKLNEYFALRNWRHIVYASAAVFLLGTLLYAIGSIVMMVYWIDDPKDSVANHIKQIPQMLVTPDLYAIALETAGNAAIFCGLALLFLAVIDYFRFKKKTETSD